LNHPRVGVVRVDNSNLETLICPRQVRKSSYILSVGQERRNNTMDDQFFMNAAYQEALKAFDDGEVPVGAVVEKEGKIIGRGYNRMEKCIDPTAHAEILAIGRHRPLCNHGD